MMPAALAAYEFTTKTGEQAMTKRNKMGIKSSILEKAWKPGKHARVLAAAAARDKAMERFHPEPDDIYFSATRQAHVSRFGADRGHVRQPMKQQPAVDSDGNKVIANKVRTWIDDLLDQGKITEDMHEAARQFQESFSIAGYDRMKTTNLLGSGGGGNSIEDRMHRTTAARDDVKRVMELVGGSGSPMWKALFWVVGHGISLREVSKQQGGPRDVWVGFATCALHLMGQDYRAKEKRRDVTVRCTHFENCL